MRDGVAIFEVADTPAAKGRVVGVFSEAARAQLWAERFRREVGGSLVRLSWSTWITGQLYAEVKNFPVAGGRRNVVFRISFHPVDAEITEADAAALATPASYTS